MLHGKGNVKGAACGHGPTHTRHGHRRNVVHADVRRRLGDEHEGFVKTEQMSFVGLDGALDTRLFMMTDEVARWPGNALSTKALEDVRHNSRNWRFIVRLQLVLVLVLQQVSLHVEVKIDLLVALELHNKEWVSCLTLSEGWI